MTPAAKVVEKSIAEGEKTPATKMVGKRIAEVHLASDCVELGTRSSATKIPKVVQVKKERTN